MKDNLSNKALVLKSFLKSMKSLRDEGILINKKDFTSQIGEWLVESIYDGKRAKSAVQKGWDVDVNGKHIQVKTHSKAEHNNNRWSVVENESPEIIDELIIIVFTHDYKLKEFYCVPWCEAKPLIKLRGKKKPRPEINWTHLNHFKIEIERLPKQEIIKLFK